VPGTVALTPVIDSIVSRSEVMVLLFFTKLASVFFKSLREFLHEYCNLPASSWYELQALITVKHAVLILAAALASFVPLHDLRAVFALVTLEDWKHEQGLFPAKEICVHLLMVSLKALALVWHSVMKVWLIAGVPQVFLMLAEQLERRFVRLRSCFAPVLVVDPEHDRLLLFPPPA